MRAMNRMMIVGVALAATPLPTLEAQVRPGPVSVGVIGVEAHRAAALAELSAAQAALRAGQPMLAAGQAALQAGRVGLVGARMQLTMAGSPFGQHRLASEPPEPWIQEDPGHQTYTRARELLNARQFRRAAEEFASLRQRFPRSGYVGDSYYWQAFALFREGSRANFDRGLELLAQQAARHPDAGTRRDAAELKVRIESQLAQRGDAQAARNITREASGPCDQDQDQGLRAAALSALLNMNAEQAVPILREVLQNRDACSVDLRRKAVFLVSQKMTDESVDILLDLAHRNPDPDQEVREQAVFWLSQVRSPEALNALASILQETRDPALQEKAIFAISQHQSEEAVAMLRRYAERNDADPEVRARAIFWIGQSGRAGGARYLRELYPRLQDAELKERVIFGVAQSNDPDSRAWLLERARDRGEKMEVRKNALFWAGQSGALGGEELRSLYGSFTDREMKEQIIFVASQRNRPDAVDFLMDVARTEKDGQLRERAVFWLGQSKDPRVAEFLMGILRK